MKLFLGLLFSSFSIACLAQTNPFLAWERVDFPGIVDGNVYLANDQLVTIREKGIFTSPDLGATWELQKDFLDTTAIEYPVVKRSDGLYLLTKAEIPGSGLKFANRFYAIDESGAAEPLTTFSTYSNLGGFQNLLEARFGHTKCATFFLQSSFGGGIGMSSMTYPVILFDGIERHFFISSSELPGSLFGRLNDNHIWRTSAGYSLYSNLLQTKLIDMEYNEKDVAYVFDQNIFYVFRSDGSYIYLNGTTLETGSDHSTIHIDDAWLTGDGQIQLLSETRVFVLNPNDTPIITKIKEANSASDQNYKLLEARENWILSRTDEMALAASTDMGVSWDAFYPKGIDYVQDIKLQDGEVLIQNLQDTWSAPCDISEPIISPVECFSCIQVDNKIFKTIENRIYRSVDGGVTFTQIFSTDTPIKDFVLFGSKIYFTDGSLYSLTPANSLIQQLIQYCNQIQWSELGLFYIDYNELKELKLSGSSETIYESDGFLSGFNIDQNDIHIFNTTNKIIVSTDGGISFVTYATGNYSLGRQKLIKKRDFLVTKSNEWYCDSPAVYSVDNGMNWSQFPVPNMQYLPPSHDYDCENFETHTPAFGFRAIGQYIYALGGNFGLYRTPFSSELESDLFVDSLLIFCPGDSALIADTWYYDDVVFDLIDEESMDCPEYFKLELSFEDVVDELIEVEVEPGGKFKNWTINQDTIISVSSTTALGCVFTTTYDITTLTTSVNRPTLAKESIQLYPNPVSVGDVVYLNGVGSNDTLTFGNIYDSKGQLMAKFTNDQLRAKQLVIPNNLAAGVYFVHLLSNDLNSLAKIVVID